MTKVLLTAFEPYDRWKANASWLALVELTRELPAHPQLTTRLYPVDFQAVADRLAADLETGYDVALHLGQAPGIARIQLESIGVNVAGELQQTPDQFPPLIGDGPAAYQSRLPLGEWARRIRAAGIPAQVSYHAGTYLCNGTLYLAHHLIHTRSLRTKAAFIHLPLATSQVLAERQDLPSLPSRIAADALRIILSQMEEILEA